MSMSVGSSTANVALAPAPPVTTGAGSAVSTSASASASVSAAKLATARAADGDYKVRSSLTSQIRDGDEDYKPIAAANAATAQSSNAVQASLLLLKKGG
jgi:hypothetical protein